MGQGLAHGAVIGVAGNFLVWNCLFLSWEAVGINILISTAAGGAVDLISDMAAKEGRVVIEREVILRANENLKHVYSFYATNAVYPYSRLLRQKHEWVVLESESRRFITVHKNPANGNIELTARNSLRQANDVGLIVAHQPSTSGEIRLHRRDHEFDLADDLQLAYVIAWARKEDPRWSFTTENCRHFCTKLRTALNDF